MQKVWLCVDSSEREGRVVVAEEAPSDGYLEIEVSDEGARRLAAMPEGDPMRVWILDAIAAGFDAAVELLEKEIDDDPDDDGMVVP